MARYIDADALKEHLEDFSKWCKDGRKQGVDFVIDCQLPNMRTADVSPRAEVAKEIFAEIRQRWARRLFECGDFSFKDFKFEDFAGDLDELFKKYTEEDKK